MENENYIYIYVKNGITFNLAFVAPFYTSKKKKLQIWGQAAQGEGGL